MSLLEKIRADALAARKAKAPEAGGLVTLIGEIDTKTKSFNPARKMTDEEVVGVVKKFLKNIGETLSHAEGRADGKILAEKAALEQYLPAQMSDEELRAFAEAKAAEGMNMGQIMGALKAERGGQYDGKKASGIVKAALAG
ncbi:GatB/YqeY domain-containing protein [Leisingera sp. XS_AS12]|uniref:GatB/YqeY domain-containing protein n=1 Tax=Leisingera sp. XS_AS12 TaxID=3241294 RepID=UPI0035197AB2